MTPFNATDSRAPAAAPNAAIANGAQCSGTS